MEKPYKSAWIKPFQEANFYKEDIAPGLLKAVMKEQRITNPETAADWIMHNMGRPYLNDTYQVNVTSHAGGEILELSIKRRDKKPIDTNHWRILQEIKNMIVGPENEGVELYPAETRKVDTANQYYLYVFADPTERFPFGFKERRVTGPNEASFVGARQREE